MKKMTYKQKMVTGFQYKSIEPVGNPYTLKFASSKLKDTEIWGLKPDEYKEYRQTHPAAKTVGFSNLLPSSDMMRTGQVFSITSENGVECGFKVNKAPENREELFLYIGVGNSKFIGLEFPKAKDMAGAVIEERKRKKEEKKQEKEKQKAEKAQAKKSKKKRKKK